MKAYRIETHILIDEDGIIEHRKEFTLNQRYDKSELIQALAPTMLFQMMGEQAGAQFEQALGEAYADANK
jgi:hypothetical protein